MKVIFFFIKEILDFSSLSFLSLLCFVYNKGIKPLKTLSFLRVYRGIDDV